jgi:hypothetical protein
MSILVAAVAIVVTTAASETWAGATVPLSETAIFIEINDTDGDAGLQVFLDGDSWKKMKVFAPNGDVVLKIKAKGNVGTLGLTEQAFESEEPGFDDLSLEDFLALFPEGTYKFEGKTTDGEEVTGSATLTHDLPGAPLITMIGGHTPEELEEGAEVNDESDVDIEWEEGDTPPEIVAYQVIVECSEDPLRVFSMDVPGDVFAVTVSAHFFEDGEECKVEVIAIEASGNKTISEVEFTTDDP